MANLRIARRSGLVLRGGRNRRDTLWGGVVFTSNTLVADTPILFGGLSAAGLALRPFTIIRVRMAVNVSSDQSVAVENYAAAIGMAVVSDQALAVGVTAVPTPASEFDSDLWFMYQSFAGRISAVTSTGINDSSPTVNVDSRAMRKVEEGQDLALVVEAFTGSLGCQLGKVGRFLLKLH